MPEPKKTDPQDSKPKTVAPVKAAPVAPAAPVAAVAPVAPKPTTPAQSVATAYEKFRASQTTGHFPPFAELPADTQSVYGARYAKVKAGAERVTDFDRCV